MENAIKQDIPPEALQDLDALAAELNVEQGGAAAAAAKAAAAEQAAGVEQYAGFARDVVDQLADAAQEAHPALSDQYPEQVRKSVAVRLAAVIAKHDGALPPWLQQIMDRYGEEVALAFCLGSVVFSSYMAIKKYQPPAENRGVE